MKKTKALIAFFLAVVLFVSQCVTSYAFASDNVSDADRDVSSAVENAENGEESKADKIIIGIEGYDFLGDEPYQTLAAVYGSELEDVPFPETIPVSVEGISEMIKLPVEWKLADGEEWDADSDVYDEDGNLISCKLVADFGTEYALSDELIESEAAMPWIKLIHQPKPVEEADKEETEEKAPVEKETETETPVKAPSKPAAKASSAATYASLPASEQTSFVYYTTAKNAFEIKGVNNGSASIKTTYAENGYTCAVNVDGTVTAQVIFGANGVTKTVSGMQITQTLSIVNDGAYVKINYDVYNPTTVAHTIGIVNHTDVQINANDRAPIYPTGTGARMAESDTGSQFNIICKNAYGVTDVDVLWFGQYGDRTNHLWNNEKTTSTVSGIDSGIAMGWNNRTIQPGQTKSYSYLLGIGKSANPPELGSEISAVVNPQTVDVSASVKDVSGMIDKLYYVLDMGTSDETTPGVLDTKTANGTFLNMGGVIQRPKSWQAGEVHTVSVWVMNDANAMSSIKTVAILIEDSEDDGDVMRPAQSAKITFAANGGSGTAPSAMNAYELQTVSLPNNTFTAPAGKQFGGWQDPSGNVYPAGADYKVPENLPSNTVELKAYWINSNESYFYLDIFEEQLNGNYKKTNATITSGIVNSPVSISESDLTVPDGFKFNSSKSKLSGTIVNAANPLHLEAYFDRLDLTVTFENGLSSTENDTVTVKYGATVAQSAIKTFPNQTYADFGGWFTSIGGKGNEFTSERKIKDNITVYAYWIPKALDVTFDYNYTNPRANNLLSRQYSCSLSPVANSSFELNLAGKVSSFPTEPARWQDTDGNTFRFDGWYLDDTKVDANTLLDYEPVTLTAKWIKVAAIVCVAEGNGTVTGQGFYDIGSDAEITWTAQEGYHVSHILIDGKWVGGDHVDEAGHLFENIQENHNVLVKFEKDDEEGGDHEHPDVIQPDSKYYLITTQKHGTSKIKLTDSFSVKEGETAKVEWEVPSGYKITKVLVNGINRDQSVIDRGYVEIETVHGNHLVDVYAEPVTSFIQQNGFYSIDAAINHGSITNSASVTEGSDFTVEWEIEKGYHAVSVLIDGAEADDVNITSISFSDIKENHSVVVRCESDDPDQTPDDDDKNLLVNTAIYGGPGSITPSSFVSTGDNTTVKWNITADIPEQYEIGYVYVDGEIIEIDEDNNLEYTFDDIDKNHKVEVYLVPNLVQFNVQYEGKGNVSPSQTLLYATDYGWFNATPAAGWQLESIFMDGSQIYPETPSLFSRIASFFSSDSDISSSADTGFSQEFENVVATHNIYVTFSKEDGSTDSGARIQLNTKLNGNGTISPSRLFVAGRDNDDIIEWNVPDNYEVESVFARQEGTAILNEVPVSGNSVTIKDILAALNLGDADLEFVNTIEFIVNTKPIPASSSTEPTEYFNLSTKIDDGGNITSSLNNIAKGEVVTVNWSTDEDQWVSKVIIDGVERPDLVEKSSVDITMDQNHTVEVKLNLADSKYYIDYYKQMLDGEYVLTASEQFDSRVNTAINLESDESYTIQVPEGYTFNEEKSVLSGTVTGASKPLHLSIRFDRILTLKVEYVDENGNEIAEGYTETYKLGDSYETRLPSERPYGYTLTKTPDNASGEMKDDVVTVTYVYSLNPASVLINYLDENGEKIPADIRDSDIITGKVNQSYKTEAASIYGYELDTDRLPVEEGKFSEEQQVVNYYYKLKDSSVRLEFVVSNDKEDDFVSKEISPARIINGKVYDDYTKLAQKELDEVLASNDVYGYELVAMPELVHNGKMVEEQIVIVYNFRQKPATVVAEYRNLSGDKICDDVVIEGKALNDYKTEAKTFDEYDFVKVVGEPEGKFTEEPITVTYYYDYKPTSVVVKYVNKAGEEIAASENILGKVKDSYNAEIKDIKNYQIMDMPANAEGFMTVDKITVTLVYDLKDTSVIVNHLDDLGNVIAPQTEIKGKVFDKFDTKHLDITGFDFVDVTVNRISENNNRNANARLMALAANENTNPEDYSDVMEEDIIVVNYIYSRKSTKVIVNYVDEKGNILDSETINGVYEDDYTTSAKDIYSYKLISDFDSTSGKMGVDPITVTYVYKQYLNIDIDGDGEPDINIDPDGDGEPDINIDTDDDGKPDINVDTTGDGKP
ncbi:MAG: MucBP domain-containing protein, partial [Eubacterium sp.]|nr:MucBP domain-containing protein [Eubacterium sp.]